MTELLKIKAKIELYKGNNVRQKPFVSSYQSVFGFFQGAATKISGEID